MSLFIFNPNPIYNIKEITLVLHRATWTAEMEEQRAPYKAGPFKSAESCCFPKSWWESKDLAKNWTISQEKWSAHADSVIFVYFSTLSYRRHELKVQNKDLNCRQRIFFCAPVITTLTYHKYLQILPRFSHKTLSHG